MDFLNGKLVLKKEIETRTISSSIIDLSKNLRPIIDDDVELVLDSRTIVLLATELEKAYKEMNMLLEEKFNKEKINVRHKP